MFDKIGSEAGQSGLYFGRITMKTWSKILCCLALWCGAANAAPVLYTFVVTPFPEGEAPTQFSLVRPGLITSDTTVPAAEMAFCLAGLYCDAVRFHMDSGLPGYRNSVDLIYHYNPYASATSVYYFPDGTFSSMGTFVAYNGNPGVMTVRPVPEPAAWLGFGAGLAMFAVMRARSTGRRPGKRTEQAG